jgi:signal transduction histidine kinase
VQKNRYLDSLAAELKQRNAELDQIVYRLSHNIRAPLHSIAGLVHLMRVDHDPMNNQEALARIDHQLDEMSSVFRSMNAFISVVMNDVAVVRLNLEQLLMEAISLQEGAPGFADVMIALDTGEQDEIYSDRGLLLTLFESIISNAVVFRSRTRRAHLRISVRRRGMLYLITFSDNGVGIDDRVKNHVFDMFYRGSEYSQGPGLGLYISREIVRKLKGSIHITSGTEGTSVMLSIPTLGNIPPVYSPAQREDGFPEW